MSGRSDMFVDASVRGLPRPMLNGLPAPYSGRDDIHGMPHTKRAQECAAGDVCSVCGEQITDERRYVVTHNQSEGELLDSGHQMHERCAKVALAHCPHMRHGFSIVFWAEHAEMQQGPHSRELKVALGAAEMHARRLMIKSTAHDVDLSQSWRPINELWPAPSQKEHE